MKVLFCNFLFPDYGLDTLFAGLHEILGADSLFEYPEKGILHGQRYRGYRNYPLHSNFEIKKTDDEKLIMLKKDDFTHFLVGCRECVDYTYQGRHLGHTDDPFFHLLTQKSQIIPTFLIDQGDSSGINYNLINKLHAKLYFKREFLPKHRNDSTIIPFNFSYSSQPHPTNDKILDLFWSGKVYPSREPFISAAEELLNKKFNNRYRQSAYLQELSRYKIGLNLKGYGNDTVRYYEIPSHGALLFSEKLDIVINHDFIDDQTAVFFGSAEEMKEKLTFLLAHESYVDKIRLAGYRHFQKYHTKKIRASQLLAKIQL